MLTHCVTHINKQFDTVRLSCSEMFSLTTVNVEDVSISHMLKKLRRELFCEQNTRTNNNNVARNFDLKTTHSVHDCDQCFTTTSGEDTLTDRINFKGVKCFLLMRTKGNSHQVRLLYNKGHLEVTNNITVEVCLSIFSLGIL